MALSDLTWASLKASVADHLAKSNLSSVIPDFIYLAEVRLFRDLTIMGMDDIETGTLSAAADYLDLPTGHNGTLSITFAGSNDSYTIEKLTPPRDFFHRQANMDTGPPSMMTIVSDRLYVAPIPDADYSYTHHYHGTLQHLGSGQATNWLLTNAPDVYLYASLLEAEPYLKNDPRIAVWRGFLEAAIASLEAKDHRQRWTGGPLVPRSG